MLLSTFSVTPETTREECLGLRCPGGVRITPGDGLFVDSISCCQKSRTIAPNLRDNDALCPTLCFPSRNRAPPKEAKNNTVSNHSQFSVDRIENPVTFRLRPSEVLSGTIMSVKMRRLCSLPQAFRKQLWPSTNTQRPTSPHTSWLGSRTKVA